MATEGPYIIYISLVVYLPTNSLSIRLDDFRRSLENESPWDPLRSVKEKLVLIKSVSARRVPYGVE